MAFEQGTANGHVDLLDKVVSFLTTNQQLVDDKQNWQVLKTESEGYLRQFFLKAPGLSGKEEIYINFRVFDNKENDRYNWHTRGALGFIENQKFLDQPNLSPKTYSYYWDKAIPYWLVGNGQRVIIVAKISTSYVVSYFGKIIPYGTPKQFPYPLFIGGVGNDSGKRWSDSSNTFDVSCVMSPGQGCQFYTSDGGWRQVRNRYSTSSSDTSYLNLLPTAQGGFFRARSSGWTTFKQVQPNPDGSYTLLPFMLATHNNYPSRNVYGELDGLLWVTGTGNAAENIITIDSQDYLVVQNMHRTDWEEYAAVRLQ
ncbi:MAG: hypothetical protein ACR2PT_21885 [Endozoicomonas sp.]